VDVGFNYSQLLSGQIKACWGFRTTAGLDLPAKGTEITMINPAEAAGITSHGYTVFATDETLSSKSELVDKFVCATIRGVRFTVDHAEEANKSLMKRDPKLDESLSLRRLKLYNEVTSDSQEYPPGYMDKEMFQNTYDRLREENVIQKDFPVETTFTAAF
jgi:NitT/TauT family transport system substrate-binding protein